MRNNKGQFVKGNVGHITHGFSNSKFYTIYCAIKQRCENKNNSFYYIYGGKGIKCEWKSFEEFKGDMFSSFKEGLSIDRINNEGNYCKQNCRWVSYKEQARNRSNTPFITYKGETKSLAEWAEYLGINYHTLYCRINISGWSIDKSFNSLIMVNQFK